MKISVVIPVYNKEKYMDDLFQCLLSQTFEEFECILIDDGSTDASGEICDKVACIDKRFEVIHIPNSGVSHARNVGIDASCGEYITFIDADDRIPNNYLENLYETISEFIYRILVSCKGIENTALSWQSNIYTIYANIDEGKWTLS